MASTAELLAAYDAASELYQSSQDYDAANQLPDVLAAAEAALSALRADYDTLAWGDRVSRQALTAMLDVLEANGLLTGRGNR